MSSSTFDCNCPRSNCFTNDMEDTTIALLLGVLVPVGIFICLGVVLGIRKCYKDFQERRLQRLAAETVRELRKRLPDNIVVGPRHIPPPSNSRSEKVPPPVCFECQARRSRLPQQEQPGTANLPKPPPYEETNPKQTTQDAAAARA